MEAKFFGLPLFVWGGLCLVVAAVFAIVWPSNKVNAGSGNLHFFILRWFHSLVWLLLAAQCFIRSAGILGGASTANLIALGSLVIYLLFMAALFLG